MKTFYLGTHRESWLARADIAVPLFLSRRLLMKRRSLPRATHRWALDSGAFSELTLFGAWTTSAATYAREVARYRDEIGSLDWAATQDWMCEPFVLAKTGLTIAEHQARTVENYAELLQLAPDLPWTPTLRGWTGDDYARHFDAYLARGLPLHDRLVGIGSVCRRQGAREGLAIVRGIATATGLRLHGFGVKTTGLALMAPFLESADSMVWSRRGRRRHLRGCAHARCGNCARFALWWRDALLEVIGRADRQLAFEYGAPA